MAAAEAEKTAPFALRGAGSVGEDLAAQYCEIDRAVRGFVRRMVRSPDDAEDLTQEVYLRIARRSRSRIQCLRAFAMQTALNLVRDRSRRSYTRSQAHATCIESLDLAAAEDPAASAMFAEELERVLRTVREMPSARRDALLMHRIGGYSQTCIAERLGVSVSMVEKHIAAALAELRRAVAGLAAA